MLPQKNHNTNPIEKNEEIAKLKREHVVEVKQFNDTIQDMEEKCC